MSERINARLSQPFPIARADLAVVVDRCAADPAAQQPVRLSA